MSKQIQVDKTFQQIDAARLQSLDRQFVWHPFTQMKEWSQADHLIIAEGKGAYIKDIHGNWYIDGVSSLWANIHGHRKEDIDRALKEQIDKIAHSTFLGLTNPPAIELARRLVAIAPKGLTRVFYSDDGSTAVEIALKMAFQYWQNRGFTQRSKFLALKNAYHGDTIGAVSVGGIELFHGIYKPLLFESFFTPSPYCYRCEFSMDSKSCSLYCLGQIEKILESSHDEIASVILEPMVQGAGGMIVFPKGFLKGIETLCRRYNVLLIADEVATGFGRTGRMFACEHESIKPDFLCLAKGITGGYLPLAATLTTEEVYNAFLGNYDEFKTFFHGHTYTANQLACTAAIASLDVFDLEKPLEAMQSKVTELQKALESLNLEYVGNIRQLGFMTGIELVKDKVTKKPFEPAKRIGHKVCMIARDYGLIIRPLGDVVVLMPPLCITHDEIKEIVKITGQAIQRVNEFTQDIV